MNFAPEDPEARIIARARHARGRDQGALILSGCRWIASAPRRSVEAVRRALIRYYQMRILLSLDERMLADIGVARDQVRALVRGAMRTKPSQARR